MELARLKTSHVKGHHVFKSVKIRLFLLGNQATLTVQTRIIIVKLNDGSNVGHVLDPLARVLAPMLDDGEIERTEGTVTGVERSAPEGVWVPGRGIEFPSEYVYTVRCKKGPLREVQKSREQKRED